MREFLREHPPLVGFGAAVLVVLTVFLGADLFSVLIGRHAHIPPSPLRPAAGSPSPKAAATAQVLQDLEVVMRRNAPSPTASPQVGGSPAAATADDLALAPSGGSGPSLQGVMLGGGVGIAVLELDGQSHTLSVGESAGGYTVAEILQDQVVLKRGGEVITVGLAGSAGGVQVSGEGPPVLPPPDAVPPPPAPAPAPARNGAPVLPPPVADTAPPASAPAPAAAPDMTRAEINAFVDQGAALALEVRGEMYVGAGDQNGVRLKFRKPDNALAKLGLKDGDVVMSMNGEPIRSPEELYNSYLILKNTPSVEFQILRGGKPDTVRFDFAE